jgi:hypothetical protein
MTVTFEEDPVEHLLTVHFGWDRDFVDTLTDADLVVAHDRDHAGCLVFPDDARWSELEPDWPEVLREKGC